MTSPPPSTSQFTELPQIFPSSDPHCHSVKDHDQDHKFHEEKGVLLQVSEVSLRLTSERKLKILSFFPMNLCCRGKSI